MNTTNLEFDSILDAMDYMSKCPMCKSPMGVDNDTNVYCRLYDNVLVNETREWTIRVSIAGDQGDITPSREVLFMDNDFCGAPSMRTPPAFVVGTQMLCSSLECARYSYVFSFQIDTKREPLVTNISLNTEYMIFDDVGTNYEITSSHTVKKTRYKYSSNNAEKESKYLELPFIQFDYLNPNKTLEKVKNLIIFT